MDGLLQFTLGLTTGGFVSGLSKADAKVKGFIGGMLSLGAISAGVWKQIEKGAQLEALARQNNTTVAAMYQTQRALKAVGIDADRAGSMIWMLNKALGGVSESGEPTGVVFGQLGMQIDDLKKMDAPAALQAIAEKLAKLDTAGGASAAGKIFGRSNAQEFMQLARSAGQFSDALKGGAVQAALFQRFAGTFHEIEILATNVKEKFNAIFLGIATGIAPALQNMLEMLSKVDLSQIGADVGTFITAITQAFREGKLSELIGDSLKLGFDALVAYVPGIFEKIGYLLLKALETPLVYIQAGMEYALTEGVHRFMTDPKFRAVLQAIAPGVGDLAAMATGGDTGPASWKEILTNAQQQGPRFNLGTGEFGLNDINADANARLADATNGFKDKWKTFWGEVTGFSTRAPKPKPGNTPATGGEQLGAAYHPEATALQKMGFVFGAGGIDPGQTTARNTTKLVTLTQQLVSRVTKGGGGGLGLLTNEHA